MGITFEFPSPLEVGHCIAVVGEVGRSKFVLKLLSDFKAFNPDALLLTSPPHSPSFCSLADSPSSESVQFCSPISSSPRTQTASAEPLGDTTPLEVSFSTSGEWEIFGATPETSSNASGFNAVRNGFRTGEVFICKINVKRDYFEIYLNSAFLSLSEHMIPVSCIQSVVIEGDCRISKMLYGVAAAVEKSARNCMKPLPPRASSCKNLTQLNLEEARIVECLVREPSIEPDPDLDIPLFLDSPTNKNHEDGTGDHENGSHNGHSYVPSSLPLPSLHRADSYQLVFDISDSEDEDAPTTPVKTRASSCLNLTSGSSDSGVIKRPTIPPPMPLNLPSLLPLNETVKGKDSTKNGQTVETTSANNRLPITRTGFAIKVSHPAIQVGASPVTPRSRIPVRAPPVPTPSPSIVRPTKDFLVMEKGSIDRLAVLRNRTAPESDASRRRNISLSIR